MVPLLHSVLLGVMLLLFCYHGDSGGDFIVFLLIKVMSLHVY